MDTLTHLSSEWSRNLRPVAHGGIGAILIALLAVTNGACGGRPAGQSIQAPSVPVPASWTIERRPGGHHPTRIRGADLFEGLRVDEDEATTDGRSRALALGYAFMDQYRGLFGLDEPRTELRQVAVEEDNLGFIHIEWSQHYRKIPISGAGVRMHVDARGRLYLLDSSLIATPGGLRIAPELNSEQATRRALQAVAPGTRGCSSCTAVLMIEPDRGNGARLTYHVHVRLGIAEVWDVVVDAVDGNILRQSSGIRTFNRKR